MSLFIKNKFFSFSKKLSYETNFTFSVLKFFNKEFKESNSFVGCDSYFNFKEDVWEELLGGFFFGSLSFLNILKKLILFSLFDLYIIKYLFQFIYSYIIKFKLVNFNI